MAIDLFAGAGGLSLGLIQAGITVVAAVEWDHDACETYRRNIGDHIIERAIEDVSPDDLPECDLIAGGPPCQGFSTAGKRDPNDPRNRLWLEFYRIVEAKRPAFILIENVLGLLTARNKATLDAITSAFTELGYALTVRRVNTADYGIPQTRGRVFIVGNRLGIANPFPPLVNLDKVPRKRDAERQLGLAPYVTVRQALGFGQPEPSHTIRSGAHGQPGWSPRHQGGYALVANDAEAPYAPETEITDEVIDEIVQRLDRPASTVTNSGRRGRAGSRKHPGHFVPTVRTDHGVIDLDQPSRAIKDGGNRDASGHRGGALPPAIPVHDPILDAPAATIRANDGTGSRVKNDIRRPHHLVPNIELDSPSPTIMGGNREPVRHRLKNRIAANRSGSTFDEPSPAIMAEHPPEEHWLADAFDVAPTIQCDQRVSQPGRHEPGQPRMMLRRLTPFECQLLQSFPSDFAFTGTKTSQHRQIGNAVPPGMAAALGRALLAAFRRHAG